MTLFEEGIGLLPRRVAILFACAVAAVIPDPLLFNAVTRSVANTSQEIINARAQLDQFVAARDLLVDASILPRY